MILTNKNIIIVLILISNAMACKITTLWNFAAGLISGDFLFFKAMFITETKQKKIHSWSKKELECLEQAHDK